VTAAATTIDLAERVASSDVAVVVVLVAIVGVLALNRGWVVLGRELDVATAAAHEAVALVQDQTTAALDEVRAAHAAQVQTLTSSHDRVMVAHSETVEAVRADRDWWRSTATKALDLGERAADSRGT